MRSIELHGELRNRNLHFVIRVVSARYVFCVFLKIGIFRDVRHEFQNFIAHALAADAAIRKDGVARKDDGGSRLVMMADLINS